MKITKEYLNSLTYEINSAAIEVHKQLGPGLLEKIYHKCLTHELKIRNINFQSEFSIDFNYKGSNVGVYLRCDFVIEDVIIVELKAHESIVPVHLAQLLTYMKLLKKPKGIIYNFNVYNLISEGQKTFVNNYFRDIPSD